MPNARKLGTYMMIVFWIVGCQPAKIMAQPAVATAGASSSLEFLDNTPITGNETRIRVTIEEYTTTKVSPFLQLLDSIQTKYAETLGISPSKITNLSLYYFIENWMGVPYQYGGEDTSGIDCSAFVQRLYAQVFCTDLTRTARSQFHMCEITNEKDHLEEGDLVFFRIRRKRISHVGIYLWNGYFVHASRSGVMISNLSSPYWTRYFVGAGRISPSYDQTL